MSPLEARLYLDRMDLSQYWPADAPMPWTDFEANFKAVQTSLEECSFLTARQRHAFGIALQPEAYLPSIPSIDVPQPIGPDLFPLNEPDADSLLLVTANSRLTFDVIASILSLGVTPAYLLLVDCLGSTVDMAMVFGNFTAARLRQALEASNVGGMLNHRRMIVPGLTAPLAEEFRGSTGWEVEVGPVCAAEIPLFLGDRWRAPDI